MGKGGKAGRYRQRRKVARCKGGEREQNMEGGRGQEKQKRDREVRETRRPVMGTWQNPCSCLQKENGGFLENPICS